MKEIKLTKGQVALVDDGDFDWLSQWTWLAHELKRTCYAYRSGAPLTYMHRLILGLEPGDGLQCDHRDGNGLNNQRHNIRVCTVLENSWNKHRRHRGKSGLMGVCERNGKWRCRVGKNKKNAVYKTFATKEEAIRCYNETVLRLRGEYAVLNPLD